MTTNPDEFISPQSHWGKLDNPTVNPDEYVAPVPPVEPEPIQQAAETSPEAVTPDTTEEAAQDASEDRETSLAASLRLEKKKAREEKARAESMAAELAALKAGQTVNPDIDRQVTERAEQIARQNEFKKTTDAMLDAGNKEFGESKFKEMVDTVTDSTGGVNQKFWQMVDAMSEVGQAHKLFKHLHDNPDVLTRIADLPATRMGAALGVEAAKMNAPKPKPVTKTPAPVSTVGRTTVSTQETDPSKLPMEEFMKWRETGYGRPVR